MNRTHSSLIDELSGDLAPVRPLTATGGAALVLGLMMLTLAGVALVLGFWIAALEGQAEPVFYIANLLLLVLGAAACVAVFRMARPGVGNRYDGPVWALGMIAVLPLTGMFALAASGFAADTHALDCFVKAMIASLGLAAGLVLWARRGAAVVPQRAATMIGIAAGSLGSAAYGLSCPIDGLAHVGIWHIAPVAAGALVGRFALAPLLRW